MGKREELTLKFGTAFNVGPQVRLLHKPHHEVTPQSLVVKVGLGPWGSPNGSFFSVVAEHLLNGSGETRFMLHGHPTLGDFKLQKKHMPANFVYMLGHNRGVAAPKVEQTVAAKPPSSGYEAVMTAAPMNGKLDIHAAPNGQANGNGAINGHSPEPDSPPSEGEGSPQKQPQFANGVLGTGGRSVNRGPLSHVWAAQETPSWGSRPKDDVFWALNVTSRIPITKWMVASCRWGLRTSMKEMLLSGGLSSAGLPSIALDKISLEMRKEKAPEPISKQSETTIALLSDDVMVLHAENFNLKKAMEELREEFQRASSKKGALLGREEVAPGSGARKGSSKGGEATQKWQDVKPEDIEKALLAAK